MLHVIEVNDAIARRAGDLAEHYALRGYDAVHLASALAVGGFGPVIATWDRNLWTAARRSGLAVAPFALR